MPSRINLPKLEHENRCKRKTLQPAFAIFSEYWSSSSASIIVALRMEDYDKNREYPRFELRCDSWALYSPRSIVRYKTRADACTDARRFSTSFEGIWGVVPIDTKSAVYMYREADGTDFVGPPIKAFDDGKETRYTLERMLKGIKESALSNNHWLPESLHW